MRSAFLVFLITTGLLLCAADDARSTPITEIILPQVSGEVGDRVATDLVIQNAPGITGITLEIGFAPNLVAPDPNITMGAFGGNLDNIHGANVIGSDTLRVAVAVFGDTLGYVGSGVLLTIEWDLLAGGTSPLTFISVLLEDNHSPPALPGFPVDGAIEVEGEEPPPPTGCECPANEPRVLVTDARGRLGDEVTIDIGVQQLPVAIDAFGLSLEYDPAVLDFVEDSEQWVDLAEDWPFCDVNETTLGSLTIGGFNPTAIPAGAVGSIVRLSFNVVCAGCVDGDTSELTLAELADDLAGMQTCCGIFTTGDACAADGDVNQSGSLSPGDAQCAFKIYFNAQTVTEDCDIDGNCEVLAADVNCNGSVTPGDALAIFNRWLQGEEPAACFASGGLGDYKTFGPHADISSSAGDGGPFVLETQPLRDPLLGLVSLPIVMPARTGQVALGLSLEYDTDELVFERLEIAPAAHGWQAMASREIAPGRLLVGGYDPWGLTADTLDRGQRQDDQVTVGRLVFRKLLADAALRQIEWTDQILGPATSRQTPSGSPRLIHLGQPRPNPMRATVAIALTVPLSATRQLEVAIYDVQGRRVRTVLDGALESGAYQLSWDRRDQAGRAVGPGIYFLRMTGDEQVAIRKLVVLN